MGGVESELSPISTVQVCSFTERNLHTALLKDDLVFAQKGDVALFQANVATGDFQIANPSANINDANIATDGVADVIAQYAEVDFGTLVALTRWRQYGDGFNAEDGEWKIQYWDLVSGTWTDWVTGIATRNASSWSSFVTETAIFTTKIRLICVAVDTNTNESGIGELEIIY